MVRRLLFSVAIGFLAWSCYQPQRDCEKFRKGKFSFTSTIDGEEITTTFVRNDTMEIDFFRGVSDTSSVRWINDCEYIVKKIHPKNKSEEQSVHMKILSTDENSYTFEYNIVGKSQRSRGTAIKLSSAVD